MLSTVNRLFFFLLLLILILSACAPLPTQYIQLESRSIDTGGKQSVLMQIDYGEVTILESADTKLYIEGQVLFDDQLEYTVDSSEKEIRTKIFVNRDNAAKVPLRVIVHVPPQMQVTVETKNASVNAESYQGDLEVASVAGTINVKHGEGTIKLRSNRGNITASDSIGQIGIVGNYGTLAAHNVGGDVSVSTIMGNISFNGAIKEGDTVVLETDHGPVSVSLSGKSSMVLKVTSASGDVACMLPEIASTPRTCDGKFGSGGGILSIRTVSGAVDIQLLP